MVVAPLLVPACFGADPGAEVVFHAYANGGKAVRTQVMLTHHLLSLLQEGEKEVLVASKRERVDASRLVLLSATASIMSEHSLQGSPMRSSLLFFSPAFLVDFCARHRVSVARQAMEIISLPQDDFTRHFARSIELLGPLAVKDGSLARTKAEEILLYLHVRYPEVLAALLAASVQDKAALSLRFVVSKHQDAGVSVPELAFLCHMSVSTFKRRFHEVYGTTPGRYLHGRRMERARTMLARQLRPNDIYHELGYASLSAFSTEFKKHFGVAPKCFEVQVGPLA
ncbi:MAG: helix-turn-helix transcriptional regulator [Flavobacteriales bacterium]|nr:helix-turn-helix transcriptional regulator [Flavobacteriales bacterium]